MSNVKSRVVLGFDSWVGGAHNFQRLVPAFKAAGFQLKLLHIGSWGGDVDRPSHEFVMDLEVSDVSHYGGLSLPDIIDLEKPSAVLFLSNDVFAHRAFNRYCQLKHIPTVHLYHGLVGIQSVQNARLYKVNPINQMRYVFERIPKALKKIWPLYARSLLVTAAPLKDWLRFFADIVNLTLGRYISKAAIDSRANACAVYTQSDVRHAVEKYGYTPNNVHVVGNPDLSRFGLSEEILGRWGALARKTENEIVYIDTGLIYAGMVFSGPEDFLLHLTKLAGSLQSKGFKLAVKLHPDHFRTEMPAEISKNGIRVIDDNDFVPSLLKCRASIVEPSTAALIPALLGAPVLMAAFGKLQNQKYGEVLMDYPRSATLTDASTVSDSIANIERRNSGDVPAWIEKNSGPLPANKMPDRVANLLKNLAVD